MSVLKYWVLLLFAAQSLAGVIRPQLGECPRGYVLESRVGCTGGAKVRCHHDADCPGLSRCCYNGCGMSCLYVTTLVKSFCTVKGVRYHPGEVFQRNCSMCRCGQFGGSEMCEPMPNCGQPNVVMLPDGPIESEDVIPIPVPPNQWLES